MRNGHAKHRWWLLGTGGFLFLSVLSLTGCTVHFIAPYDATLDQTMTHIQQDTELFFGQLEAAAGTDAASYDSTKLFYVHTEATLRTLLTRAQAVPRSQQVAIQIAAIESTVERIQSMHQRDKTLNPANLTGDRQSLESEFRSFFTLELALKSHLGGPANAALAPAVTAP